MATVQLIPVAIDINERRKTFTLLENYEVGPNKGLPHTVFMDVLARRRTPIVEVNLDHSDPAVETILDDCKFDLLKQEFKKTRNGKYHYKDHSKIYLENAYTIKDLEAAVRQFIIGENELKCLEVEQYIETLLVKPKGYDYFFQKGISEEEAFCCSFILSTYTGITQDPTRTSAAINRACSQYIRCNNGLRKKFFRKEFYPIMHYMLKALSHIPSYIGLCVRATYLSEAEQSLYEVGSVVGWYQFSSSTARTNLPEWLSRSNTLFKIYSKTGKAVSAFSNAPGDQEVLFAPFSTFLVTKKEKVGDKTHIYIRQVDLSQSLGREVQKAPIGDENDS